MSRIGKQPIALPAGVVVKAEADGLVTVTGPKGTLTRRVTPRMEIKVEGATLTVVRPTDSDDDRSQHGLVRTLVSNMVVGVSAGYQKVLNVTGVGYRVLRFKKTPDVAALQTAIAIPATVI